MKKIFGSTIRTSPKWWKLAAKSTSMMDLFPSKSWKLVRKESSPHILVERDNIVFFFFINIHFLL